MHRLVIACIMIALMALGGWAEGQATSSGMDCAQETDYPVTPDIVQNNEVFHLVVIGDSIAWGAGLEKDKKYSFLVAEWLSKQLKRPVNVKILAHTGATIGKTDDPRVQSPDLSSGNPTLMEQVDSIPDPEHVDMILVSGGINDVTVDEIIKLDHLVEPSESTLYYLTPDLGRNAWDSAVSGKSTCSEADLRQKTGEIKPLMQDLLNKLITNCPKATIVVTGYYPIISVKSTGLTEAIRTLMPSSQFISDYQKLDNPIEKVQLSKKSDAFYDESTKSLEAAVQGTKSKRIAFARIEFKPENCYGAGKDSFLWRIESGQTKTDDPLYECRVALVGDKNGIKDKRDKVAAVGHPNEKGAGLYFSAIKEAIEKTSPEFFPKVEDFRVASPNTRAPGESFEIDYVVSDNGELGLKQVELWRTQEKDKWPEKPENPIQTNALAGGNGPVSGSFTDSPSAPGKYWYGVHVVDNAGNWNDERNSNTNGQPGSFEPVEVEVKAASGAKVHSQAPSEEWNRTYGRANTDDVAISVQPTFDGGYILAGNTVSSGKESKDYWHIAWLIKTDSRGNEIWNRTFFGGKTYFDDWYYGGDISDYSVGIASVHQMSDGGYILAGANVPYHVGHSCAWLMKTDSNGNEIWMKCQKGGVSSVEPTSDGGYIIAGTESFSNNQATLIKTNSTGDEVWSKIFSVGSGHNYGSSVQPITDGGYILAGSRIYDGVGWLIKTDEEGNELWNRTLSRALGRDDTQLVQSTSDGGYIIACNSMPFYNYTSRISIGPNALLIKTDSAGNELWNKTFGGNYSNQVNSVLTTSDGGYILSGSTYSFGAGSSDAWLIKTDSAGNELWNMTFGGKNEDVGNSIQPTSDGGYIIAGSTKSYGAGGQDAWLIKVAPI